MEYLNEQALIYYLKSIECY